LTIFRVFLHPDYEYPSIYADIAVLQLNRRILYDFEKYGDSPDCLGLEDKPLVGFNASQEGYGCNENYTLSDVPMRSDVRIIDRKECADYFRHNVSENAAWKARLDAQLKEGISDDLLCSIGFERESDGVYSGPCRGDSGSGLYVTSPDNDGQSKRRTVEGIVSGGIGCGLNIPKFYTRISFHEKWIKCIMRQVEAGKSQDQIENICRNSRGIRENDNPIFGSKDFLDEIFE